jgi:hypothetical protein
MLAYTRGEDVSVAMLGSLGTLVSSVGHNLGPVAPCAIVGIQLHIISSIKGFVDSQQQLFESSDNFIFFAACVVHHCKRTIQIRVRVSPCCEISHLRQSGRGDGARARCA